MEDAAKPVLQKPPGYKDPLVPASAARPPPKKAQLPPAFRHPGKPPRGNRGVRSCCCRFCCYLLVVIFVLAVLLAVAGGIGYLWFEPRLPSFRVQNVTASVFKVTMTSDGTFLDASATVKIHITNPNAKLGLSCHEADATVAVADEDGDVEMGTGSAAGYTLGKKNSTTTSLSVTAKRSMIDDAVGTRLKARYKSKNVQFLVEMRTKVKFVVSGKSTPNFPLRVKCVAVSLKQVGSGRSLPKCDLNFFNGIF
ncbi:hypothetical protein HPP92_004867 [Vanilla planifolia]|uniref:Late embryogenesis abundant protein LEA-2 subgroup domain-containing protein n=1 Tax=Vanilla planifolia TaxID=51239 RepID=A0A835RNM1_VANPL|nr:hypothetical protein HPP92_004867 [Vanilla planifolia]